MAFAEMIQKGTVLELQKRAENFSTNTPLSIYINAEARDDGLHLSHKADVASQRIYLKWAEVDALYFFLQREIYYKEEE